MVRKLALVVALGSVGCVQVKDVEPEGEPCVELHDWQGCRDAWHREGITVCAPSSPEATELVWSQCLVDACENVGGTRTCTMDDGAAGVERCIMVPGEATELRWGACAPDVCSVGACVGAFFCESGALGESYLVENAGCRDTPLVLVLAGQEPVFRAAAAGAAFDISGQGQCVAHDWPTESTPWLVRDLDRSGGIEGGHELFGSGTWLRAGRRARHGFEALAELDGDGDGAITPRDPAWPELLAWADADGDRRASGWELLPITAYGVEALALGFTPASVCDARGNCVGERAAMTLRHGGGWLVDVYLACE